MHFILGEFYDPYVPEYSEPRYYPSPRADYVIAEAPMAFEQPFPWRMHETSFAETPHRPHQVHRPKIDPRQPPRGLYFKQPPPRPSSLYPRARKSQPKSRPYTIEETDEVNPPNKTPQKPKPSGEYTTSQASTETQAAGKSVVSSSKISPGQSWDSRTDDDFKNYSMNETEARKLVSRVLDRAKSKANED